MTAFPIHNFGFGPRSATADHPYSARLCIGEVLRHTLDLEHDRVNPYATALQRVANAPCRIGLRAHLDQRTIAELEIRLQSGSALPFDVRSSLSHIDL
jgi:hypothetical protein